MQNHTVPNFSDIFKTENSYEELVKDICSDSVIAVCIAIINELHSQEEKFSLQRRIYGEWSKTFTVGQKQHIDLALKKFKVRTNKQFKGLIFGKRYLLEMILKELSQCRDIREENATPPEYNLFKAYLLIVQSVNQNDYSKIKFNTFAKGDVNAKYELLWKGVLPQLEFNERPHLIFETYKLLCFLKFAADKYPTEIKEYLARNHFKNIGQLIASFSQVNNTALSEDPTAMLKKLSYLLPNKNVDEQHLLTQTINKKSGLTNYTIRTIKEFPLYFKADRGYMVIDPDFYFRKNYFGPFFELFHQTKLKERESFNQYSINISSALEDTLLKPLLTVIGEQTVDVVMHFDDKTKDVPDGYLRIGKMVFLFEYKAYIFKEQLTQYPTVNEVKQYIEEKFVKSEKGKKKGITQLRDQINILKKGGFHFDKASFFSEGDDEIRIFPIILHHDFMFSLPGINEYLNGLFEENQPVKDRFEVMPLTIMNLSVLLDMALGKRDLLFMECMLVDYFNYQQQHRLLFAQKTNSVDFFLGHISFDELFQMHFVQQTKTPEGTQKSTLNRLLDLSKISFDKFNKDI